MRTLTAFTDNPPFRQGFWSKAQKRGPLGVSPMRGFGDPKRPRLSGIPAAAPLGVRGGIPNLQLS
jgi:hypothetical protein